MASSVDVPATVTNILAGVSVTRVELRPSSHPSTPAALRRKAMVNPTIELFDDMSTSGNPAKRVCELRVADGSEHLAADLPDALKFYPVKAKDSRAVDRIEFRVAANEKYLDKFYQARVEKLAEGRHACADLPDGGKLYIRRLADGILQCRRTPPSGTQAPSSSWCWRNGAAVH